MNRPNSSRRSGCARNASGRNITGTNATTIGTTMSESAMASALPRCRQAMEKSISSPLSSNMNSTPSHATVSSMPCWIASAGNSAAWNPGKKRPSRVGPSAMPTSSSAVSAGCFHRRNSSPSPRAHSSKMNSCARNSRMWLSSR